MAAKHWEEEFGMNKTARKSYVIIHWQQKKKKNMKKSIMWNEYGTVYLYFYKLYFGDCQVHIQNERGKFNS